MVLLPIQEFRLEERIALFKAGLQLGLKDYFKGKPDHIMIRETESYNQASKRRESYLVLYETIPGGTGYLSKLFDTDNFTEVLKRAYDRIANCSCKDEGKDGCYRCIYTYGNQFERTSLSREEAEQLFKDILDKTDEWNQIDSLQDVQGFANNEESDLEHLFVDSIEKIAKKSHGWLFSQENEKGIKKYKLIIQTNDSTVTYEIWPQNLGVNLQGIRVQTRPDFLIKCVAVQKGGHTFTMDEIDGVKAIALYLDGHSFHATENHPRFPADVHIRNTITKSEKYYHWTLTWNDFKEHLLQDFDFVGSQINETSTKDRLLQKHPAFKGTDFDELQHQNNLSRFIRLLKTPIVDLSLIRWSSLVMFNCQTNWLARCCSEENIMSVISSQNHEGLEIIQPSNPKLFSHLDGIKLNQEAFIMGFVRPTDFKFLGYSTFINSGEWEKENWEKFWQVYNLTQFHGIVCNNVEDKKVETETSPEEELFSNFDESLHDIVRQLIDNNIDFNKEYDFDLLDGEVIIATAELGSHDKKIVINPFDDSESVFVEHGYKIIDPETFKIEDIL